MTIDPNQIDPNADPYLAWQFSQQPYADAVPVDEHPAMVAADPAVADHTAFVSSPGDMPIDAAPVQGDPQVDAPHGHLTPEQMAAAPVGTTSTDLSDHDQFLQAMADSGATMRTELPNPFDEARHVEADRLQSFTSGNVDPAARQQTIDEMTPEDRTRAVSKMTADEFTQYQAHREGSLLARQAELEHQANLDNEQRARRDLEMHAEAMQKAAIDSQALQADAARIVATKFNPDRYTQNRGVLGAIRDFTSTLLTGLGGDPEIGLRQFNQRVNNDIEGQKADIANAWQGIGVRRNAISDEVARHGDMFRAQEAYRVAAYQAQINDIQTQMQQFDPQGATAIRGRQALDQLHAAQGQAISGALQQDFKNKLDVLKENNAHDAMLGALAGQAETSRHNKAEEGIAHGRLALDRTNAGKADKADIARQEKLQERVIDGMPLGIDKDGKIARGPISQKSGEVFIPRTDEQAKALQKQKPYVNDVNRLTNQMARDIADLGTLDKSSTLATEKHQRLMADREALIFALHGAQGIEGFRPGTAEMLEKLLGGVDPDKWGRDATSGILRARDNINADFNESLVGAGYDGPAYSPPDTSKLEAPTETENEQVTHRAIKGAGIGGEGTGDTGAGTLTPDIAFGIEQLAARAAQGDQTAGEGLVRIATDSTSRQVKLYAQGALDRLSASSTAAITKDVTAPSDYEGASVAHETLPPEPKKASKAEKLHPHPRGTAR